jgi:hypothetical protein
MAIRLDLNNPAFQSQWFRLEKDERNAVLQSCVKLAALGWEELYRDKGFRWELIHSRRAADGGRLYSIRITRAIRAVVRRSGEFLEFLTLHADHDSAYSVRDGKTFYGSRNAGESACATFATQESLDQGGAGLQPAKGSSGTL